MGTRCAPCWSGTMCQAFSADEEDNLIFEIGLYGLNSVPPPQNHIQPESQDVTKSLQMQFKWEPRYLDQIGLSSSESELLKDKKDIQSQGQHDTQR